MAEINVGDAMTLRAKFRVSDVLTDPTAIALEVQDPGGNVDTYTYALGNVTKDSTGSYSKVITFDEAGWWVYEWTATGTVIAVQGNKIYVRPQLI